MKIFLSCRAKSRHPDALSRVTLRDASILLGMAVILIFGFVGPVFGLTPGDLSRVTVEQHPGQQLSHDLVFRGENGQQFRFSNSVAKQPTVLVPGYYRCPMLCPLINDGLIQALQNLRMSVGRDFQVVNFSIDPGDTPADAVRKKSEYLRRYGRSGASEGWHCVIGDQRSIAQLADEIGFRYAYDPETKQYAHPSGVIVLTPEGKISRYIFGATFDAGELRDALIAARDGESTSTLSKLFLLCYHYNPITGKYSALTLNGLRIISLIFVLAIACWIFHIHCLPTTSTSMAFDGLRSIRKYTNAPQVNRPSDKMIGPIVQPLSIHNDPELGLDRSAGEPRRYFTAK